MEQNQIEEIKVSVASTVGTEISIQEQLKQSDFLGELIKKKFTETGLNEYSDAILDYSAILYRVAERTRKSDQGSLIDEQHVKEAAKLTVAANQPGLLKSIVLPGLGFAFVGASVGKVPDLFSSAGTVSATNALVLMLLLVVGFVIILWSISKGRN